MVCEIMNDDGTMARMPHLVEFAKKHSLKIATIADLIAYRLRNDRIVKVEVETNLQTIGGGEFRTIVYRNTADLGIREMILLSNTKRSLVGLEGHDLKIIEQRAIQFSREHPIPVRDKFYA